MDRDGDGYGTGSGCEAADCDDGDANVWELAQCEVCRLDPEGEGCSCASETPVPCYTGWPATEGTGPCVGGIRECAEGKWGACRGEVVPQPESLACNGIDDDCNGWVDEHIIDPAGYAAQGQFCTLQEDCPCGSACLGQCQARCDPYSSAVLGGCPPFADCYRLGSSSRETIIGEHFCIGVECDVLSQTGCSPGYACLVFAESYTRPGRAIYACGLAGTLEQGMTCSTANINQCLPGFYCEVAGTETEGKCVQLCNANGGEPSCAQGVCVLSSWRTSEGVALGFCR